MSERARKLEAQNVGDKEWFMRGEADSGQHLSSMLYRGGKLTAWKMMRLHLQARVNLTTGIRTSSLAGCGQIDQKH